MRQTFGDYRAKMAEDERKFALNPSSFKFRGQASGSRSYFVKKAALQQPNGKDFRFNFTVDKLDELSLGTDQKSEDGATDASKMSESELNRCNPAKVELNLGSGTSFQFNFAIEPDPEREAS